MLEQLLSLLGTKATTKTTIGVSVSPSIGLEMIEINPKSKAILKYGCKPLEYDASKREIANYEEFKEALVGLFEELSIDKRSNIVLTLPSVHYGLASLPTMLGDAGVNSALVSEVEQNSYIFKRQDPVISWVDAYPAGDKENREILYGALQQNAIDEINAVCSEVGCNLMAIESSHNSILKCLDFNALAEEQMTPNTTWNLMIISNNSYSMITLNEKSVIEYREEPLALRSFVGDEIYEAIISSSQITLKTVPSNYLYIISETDMVSAEVLSMKIPFDGNIKFLESNKYVQTPLMQASYDILPNLLLKISPEAIGTGLYINSNFPFKFNLLGKKVEEVKLPEESPVLRFGSTEIELNSNTLKRLTILIAIIILIPAGLVYYGLNFYNGQQQAQLDEINASIERNRAELEKYESINKKNVFDEKMAIIKTQAQNRNKLILYTAIGLNLPQKTWLIYLKFNNGDKFDLIGRATNVEDVYTFFKGMKMSVIDSNLRLSRLEMSANSVDNLVVSDLNSIKPTFYEFELTNMTDEEIKQVDDEINTEYDEEGKPKERDENAPRRKRGFLFGDFLNLPESSSDSTENNETQDSQQNEPPSSLPANLESIEKF
ncbi:MAG: hypothetical protein ACI4SM_01865 [Candidatus Gastranaerophilaceae bacterium]